MITDLQLVQLAPGRFQIDSAKLNKGWYDVLFNKKTDLRLDWQSDRTIIDRLV